MAVSTGRYPGIDRAGRGAGRLPQPCIGHAVSYGLNSYRAGILKVVRQRPTATPREIVSMARKLAVTVAVDLDFEAAAASPTGPLNVAPVRIGLRQLSVAEPSVSTSLRPWCSTGTKFLGPAARPSGENGSRRWGEKPWLPQRDGLRGDEM